MKRGAAGNAVLCVTDTLRGHATASVRGNFYKRFFEGEGWNVRMLDIDASRTSSVKRVLEAARECAWVVLVKVPSLPLARALRADSRAVVAFDFSDALWKRIHRHAGWHDLERVLATVDAVFCENTRLVPYARRRNDSVFVAPAAVPLEAFDAARARRASAVARGRDAAHPVRLGWVGSRTTVQALEKVREPLAALAARHAVELRVLGASQQAVVRALRVPGGPGIPRTVLPLYDEATMIDEMLDLDVGLYPVPLDAEDYAARGPLKALLYMAAGLPVACAPGGDCSELLRDGESGMLADGTAEWERKLEALILSPGLRARMGAAALETVRKTQSPEILFGDLRRALATVRRHEAKVPDRAWDAWRSFAFRLDALIARAARAPRVILRRLFPPTEGRP